MSVPRVTAQGCCGNHPYQGSRSSAKVSIDLKTRFVHYSSWKHLFLCWGRQPLLWVGITVSAQLLPVWFGWVRPGLPVWAMDSLTSWTWLIPDTGWWTVWTCRTAAHWMQSPGVTKCLSLLLALKGSWGVQYLPSIELCSFQMHIYWNALLDEDLWHHSQSAHALTQKRTRVQKAAVSYYTQSNYWPYMLRLLEQIKSGRWRKDSQWGLYDCRRWGGSQAGGPQQYPNCPVCQHPWIIYTSKGGSGNGHEKWQQLPS